MNDQHTDAIAKVVDDVRAIARKRNEVSVGEVVHELGSASQSGLILLPALVAATPLSGIPGLTSVCGLLIALMAAHMLFPSRKLWLPGFLLRRRIEADDLCEGLNKAQPAIDFLDRHSRERLRLFVNPPGNLVLKLLMLACGLIMPFLEVIPFTGSLMAGVVLFLAVAMLTCDGLFAVIGLAFFTGALGLVWRFI